MRKIYFFSFVSGNKDNYTSAIFMRSYHSYKKSKAAKIKFEKEFSFTLKIWDIDCHKDTF
jgi:hypothetical protein